MTQIPWRNFAASYLYQLASHKYGCALYATYCIGAMYFIMTMRGIGLWWILIFAAGIPMACIMAVLCAIIIVWRALPHPLPNKIDAVAAYAKIMRPINFIIFIAAAILLIAMQCEILRIF